MNPLERRTAKLEQAAHPDANQVDIIIRRIVGNEVVRAIFGDKVADRRVDEDECAFIERAEAEALARTDRRPCRLLLLPEPVLQ
jgi:hypothetical protein